MYTCYIIDDESYSIQFLQEYIEKIPDLVVLGSNTNPLKALDEINSGLLPDIIILDVEMPELSGLSVVDLLPKNCAVIFITGHLKYAVNGYDKEIADFLFRPVKFERFEKAISKARKYIEVNSMRSDDSFLLFNAGIKGQVIQIDPKKIIFVEALDHLMNITTLTKEYKVNISMKELENKLLRWDFLRIHRSFIINRKLLKLIQATQVIMLNEKLLPIGRKYKTTFLNKVKLLD